MRNFIFVAALAVAGVATALQCSEARAGWPYTGCYGGFGEYSIYSTESIPFYWRYSPVYYSMPVPRSYGYSPYAYPPGVQTPEVIIEPEMTINPFVPRNDSSAEPTSKVTSRVKRIQNPFVTTSTKEVVAEESNDDSTEQLSMVLENWKKLSPEARAQIVELLKSAE